jgi:hypothetical protein
MNTILQQNFDLLRCIVQPRASCLDGHLRSGLLDRAVEIIVDDYACITLEPYGLAQVDTPALFSPGEGTDKLKTLLLHHQPGDACAHLAGSKGQDADTIAHTAGFLKDELSKQ